MCGEWIIRCSPPNKLANEAKHWKQLNAGIQRSVLRGGKCSMITSLSFFLQDEANKMGGKWIIRLKKGLASRCWENLILAMLGEQFMVGEEICGAVISVRFQVSTLACYVSNHRHSQCDALLNQQPQTQPAWCSVKSATTDTANMMLC